MNKNVWVYWDSGEKHAPDIVKECIKSWKVNNPDMNVLHLGKANAVQYYKPDRDFPSVQAYTNNLKLHLLNYYGGFWCDATTLCTRPLSEWAEPYTKTGFFGFRDPTPDMKVCSWFLYSDRGNAITNMWLRYSNIYWKSRVLPNGRNWSKDIFRTLCVYPEFRREWERMVNYEYSTPELNPHFYMPYTNKSLSKYVNKDERAPLYKLTYRIDGHHDGLDKIISEVNSTK